MSSNESGQAERVLVNRIDTRCVDSADRGLQYGHGVFETCRVIAGRIPLWPYHRARLHSGAQRLGIAVELAGVEADVGLLSADVDAAVDQGHRHGFGCGTWLRRGGGGRCNRMVSRFAMPLPRSDGRLIEGTASNLFLVYLDRIVTAALQRCGAAGVVRRILLEQRPGIDRRRARRRGRRVAASRRMFPDQCRQRGMGRCACAGYRRHASPSR